MRRLRDQLSEMGKERDMLIEHERTARSQEMRQIAEETRNIREEEAKAKQNLEETLSKMVFKL